MVVLEVVAVGEACTKDCRRRGGSSTSSLNVLGMDSGLGRRHPEHMKVASNVHVVALKEVTRVN